MVTNYPRSITTTRLTAAHDEHVGVVDTLRQWMCGLHGHDALVQFERDRMFLRCMSCGHETHGWELREPRPHAVREIARRPVTRPQLVEERKIA